MDDNWKLPPYTVETLFIPFTQIIDWGLADLGITELWPEFGMGDGATIALLDTGRPTHPDLIENSGVAKDFTNSNRGALDVQGHATHCAGILGARHNEAGTVGWAPEIKMIYGKVLGDNGSGNDRGIVAGIFWAAEQGANVISMSLGSPSPSPMIEAAINRLPPNVILCCACGNSGPGEEWDYPGAFPRSMSVASTNQQRLVSKFSSRNAEVDIAAPGEKITSTWLEGQTATLSGSSMATPVPAAMGAIATGYCVRTNRPELTHAKFYELLTTTADDIGPTGRDTGSGFGLINPKRFFAALKAIPPLLPPPVVPPVILPPGTQNSITVTLTGNVPAGSYKLPTT